MNKRYKIRGSTLIELLLTLALLGLLSTVLFGILVCFSKSNQISSSNLTIGINANNLYEQAKGMNIPELSELSATGIVWNNGDKYTIKAERYSSAVQSSADNQIDLAIHSDLENGYTSYIFGDSIKNMLCVSGKGNLNINLSPNEQYIDVTLANESAVRNCKSSASIHAICKMRGNLYRSILMIYRKPTG